MKNKYIENRNKMVLEAEGLLKEGKIDEANTKMEEIEALDKEFKEASTAQANMNALKDNPIVADISNKGESGLLGNVTEIMNLEGGVSNNKKDKEKEYVNAWAKYMMDKTLDEDETEIFNSFNENFRFMDAKNEGFTHTTGNTSIVIPESVVAGIWKEIEDTFPLWNDVAKLKVKGNLSLIKGETSTDAGWYEEEEKTEDGIETFGELNLTGCELSRAITVSWKLNTMAIDDFIPYIQGKLAERMGAALGYGTAIGKGKPGTEDAFKPEPTGIITSLSAEEDMPQLVEYDKLAYESFTKAFAKIKSGYLKGANIYATNTTIWNDIANVVDANGRPYFVPDVVDGGVGRILGRIVKEDDSIPEGMILIGNPSKGYLANINQAIILDQEDHKKARETDHIAYAVVDGDVVTTKAFALIAKKGAVPAAKVAVKSPDKTK